jgi:large subunit ribosomal protein L4
MKLKVFSPDATQSTEKDFPNIPQFEGEKGLLTLKQVILAIQANKRQGNASTKLRSEVSGTGKKPFRQKGTGNARQGSKRTVQQRGGGVVHGPRPRSYNQKLNKKIKQRALQRALFDRAQEKEVNVIEHFSSPTPKTCHINTIIEKIAPKGTILLIDDTWNENIILATRNIERVSLNEANTVNAFDISLYDKIIISEQGMQKILQRANKQYKSNDCTK